MRRLAMLAVLAAGLALQPIATFAEPTIEAATATVSPGGTAFIPIRLNADATNVSGVEVALSSTASPANAGTLSVALSGVGLISEALYDTSLIDGTFRAAVVKAEPFDGPVVVLALQFRVPADAVAGTVYTLKLSAKLNDPNGVPIAVQTADGAITVQ